MFVFGRALDRRHDVANAGEMENELGICEDRCGPREIADVAALEG